MNWYGTTINIDNIPIISVSYNSPELIENLLCSLRTYYANPVTIIDGSNGEYVKNIEEVCTRYPNVSFIHFDYNIHHGPGMAWAFQNLALNGQVLVLDSDVVILNRGFLESLMAALEPDCYGVGNSYFVNEDGFPVDYQDGAIKYLHPFCMLCNIEVVRQWPMPTKHGAPMTEPMLALHRAGKQHLIRGLDWNEIRDCIRHDWAGTVKQSGSYNLDEWSEAARQSATLRSMIISLVPAGVSRIVEIGSDVGALARACKEANPGCQYTAVEITADNNTVVKGLSNQVISCDIDTVDDGFFRELASADCWILNQCLERIRQPEQLLRRIRSVISTDACVITVVPNAQHWSIQAGICRGDLHLDENSPLQADHLKWFTRTSMLHLLTQSGFRVVGGYSVQHNILDNEMIANAIRQFAASLGVDPDQALQDAQPVQYVFKVVPA
jgi:hypothetical protein